MTGMIVWNCGWHAEGQKGGDRSHARRASATRSGSAVKRSRQAQWSAEGGLTIRSLVEQYRQINRFRRIAEVMTRHGFGFVLDHLGWGEFRRRPFRRAPKGAAPSDRSRWSRIRRMLEELGPTYVKIGQLLSTRPDLIPGDLLSELEKLQDHLPPISREQVREVIEAQLGAPLDRLYRSLDEQPIAAASLGQVHMATLHTGERVVVKVQRPGIERTIRTDVGILRELAALANRRSPWGKVYDFVATVDEFEQAILGELEYRDEGRHADLLRQQFADDPTVRVPHVYWELTTGRVLTLEHISGIKVTEVERLREAGHDVRQVAQRLVRAVFQQIFIDGFFHADPHPGNLVVTESGAVAFLDMGMVGRLDEHSRRRLVDLALAVAKRDSGAIVRSIQRLDVLGEETDVARLRRDVDAMIGRYAHLPLREFDVGEAVAQVMDLAFRHRLRLPHDFGLLSKTLVTVEGIGRRIDPSLSVMDVVQPLAERLARERLSWSYAGERIKEEVGAYGQIIADLPGDLSSLLHHLAKGEMKLRFQVERSERLLGHLSSMVNRISVSVVVASLIVGTALVAQSRPNAALWRLPFPEVGFILAILLGLWLLYAIFRSSKW